MASNHICPRCKHYEAEADLWREQYFHFVSKLAETRALIASPAPLIIVTSEEEKERILSNMIKKEQTNVPTS